MMEPVVIQRRIVEGQVTRTVASHLGVRVSEVRLEADLKRDLGADLLDLIELAVTVEEQFRVRIPFEDMLQAKTVSDLVRLALSAVNVKGGYRVV